MTTICFRTITTKSRAPDVVVKNLFEIDHSSPLIDDSANDVEVGGLDEKAKPIPFLIRNTTADGMPISIGSLKAIDSPKFSSFNPFIKRLPPPKKYVFEPRQVLPGDKYFSYLQESRMFKFCKYLGNLVFWGTKGKFLKNICLNMENVMQIKDF